MPLVGQAARLRRPSQTTAVLVMCVILIVIFSISLNGFLTLGNLFALARNISILGILSLGMAVVVIGRGLDLSQVASFAAATAIAIIIMNAGYSTGLALFIGLVLAIAIGILNGFLISVVEMPPLLTTLASSLERAWDASSAAAGSLMLGAKAKTDIQALLRKPQLQ